MRPVLLLLPLLGLCAVTSAQAEGIVLTNGIGRDCYVATLTAPTSDNDQRAISICNEAVHSYPQNSHNRAASLINRSEIFIRAGRFRQAVADTDESIAIDRSIAVAYLNRGAGLIGLQRYDEALSSLDKAIAMGVNKMELAYYDRALAKESKGDVKGAYYDFRKSSELAPDFPLASEQLARFTVTRGNP